MIVHGSITSRWSLAVVAKLMERNGKIWDILEMRSADDGLIGGEKGKEDQAVLQVQKIDAIGTPWEPGWQTDTNFKSVIKNMANIDNTKYW